MRPREVIAIVAGTRTKSGSTNFLRLHVMGEQKQGGVRFTVPREEEHVEEVVAEDVEERPKRITRKPAAKK